MKTFLASVLLFAAPASVLAQDEWEEQVRGQLTAVGVDMINDGWTMRDDIYIDSLDENAIDYFEIPLDQGVNYAIVGVCDNDCSDVDLYLRDGEDTDIVSDTEVDDFPLLQVVAQYTGDHWLRVRMYDCEVEPCRYGVAVFSE
jgi:hypothetical protein